jgi:hypothetical protein
MRWFVDEVDLLPRSMRRRRQYPRGILSQPHGDVDAHEIGRASALKSRRSEARHFPDEDAASRLFLESKFSPMLFFPLDSNRDRSTSKRFGHSNSN